jgi:hypothetical protein
MFNNKITYPKPLMCVVHHQKNSNATRIHTKQCKNAIENTFVSSNRQQLMYGIETNNRKQLKLTTENSKVHKNSTQWHFSIMYLFYHLKSL